ncbi:MAG: DinB family protein [Fimbriimonadaceae bacterium]
MDLKELAISNIDKAHDRYRKDIESLTHEQLDQHHGGARSAYDFTYEVANVNNRVAMRVRGEDPGAPSDGWTVAPDDFKSKEACTAGLAESVANLKSALEACADFTEVRDLPLGKMSIFELANFMLVHMTYHDGQLNFIQAMADDQEVHW